MREFNIKTCTACYTGGGIHIYYGQLESGVYFRTADEWESVCFCNADTSDDAADYMEFYDKYLIREITGSDFNNFFEYMLLWILYNEPKGNYQITEIRQRYMELF